jgi:phosphatidylglycerol---prolipoprotein diacylglyceryl transferase
MDELLASFTYTPMQRWGPVSPHGVGTAVGFFAGAWLMARRAEPRGIPRSEVYNAVTWGAIGAIIGARGFYVLGHLNQFDSIGDMLAVWEGGLTMFGGFIGGLVLGLGYLRRHGFAIPPALDAAAPGFAVGVIFGRVGDLIIADHLGRATDFFLGYRIPDAEIAPGYGPPTYVPGEVVHQTALYDLAGALVLLGVLYLIERRKPATGTLFASFSLWYGLQRVFIDFTRNRELIESFFFGLSGSQWAGIGFAAGGLYALIRIRGRAGAPPDEPTPEPVPVSAPPPQPSTREAAEPPRASSEPSEPNQVVGEMPVPQPQPVPEPAAPPDPPPVSPTGLPEPPPPKPEPTSPYTPVEDESSASEEAPPEKPDEPPPA